MSDTAIFCTSGPLEYDSAIFLRGTGIHRASLVQGQPEAERRRRSALALPRMVRQRMGPAEFGVAGSVVGEDGKVRELPRPKNPFRAKASAT